MYDIKVWNKVEKKHLAIRKHKYYENIASTKEYMVLLMISP